MIKRCIEIAQTAAFLHLKEGQLKMRLSKEEPEHSIPLEDVGMLILAHPAITCTQALLAACMEQNVVVVTCNPQHHPIGMMLSLNANTLTGERLRAQVNSSEPLKKRLWQDIVKAKIRNQALLLSRVSDDDGGLGALSKKVKLNDEQNMEARAARRYWPLLFNNPEFRRKREAPGINSLLNYGYAILRAATARALVGTGLHPGIGIHHSNKYNAYGLADDVMEPLRPWVDMQVHELVQETGEPDELKTEHKRKLLEILTLPVLIKTKKYPLMEGLGLYSASLAQSLIEADKSNLIIPSL